MRRVIGVIQARWCSTRLPGKVLADLAGVPLLGSVIARTRRAQSVGEWVVATSTRVEDDPIAVLAESFEVKVFRGSEDDVLDRFVSAARRTEADVVVRVTGDSPVVEPTVIDQAVRAHLACGVDYTGAKDAREFPIGIGCEVVSRAPLEQAWAEGRTPEDREHVTYYLLQHPERFSIQFISTNAPWRGLPVRLVVDEPADLELMRKLFERLAPSNPHFGIEDVLWLYHEDPDLFRLNVAVEERPTSFPSMRCRAGAGGAS